MLLTGRGPLDVTDALGLVCTILEHLSEQSYAIEQKRRRRMEPRDWESEHGDVGAF